MPWFRVEDSFYAHPKVLALPRRTRPADVGLWILAGTWAAFYLTDGYVPEHVVATLGGAPAGAARLVKCGLWDHADGGYQFHDWQNYQPTRQQVLTRRETDRVRQARGRARQDRDPTSGRYVTP